MILTAGNILPKWRRILLKKNKILKRERVNCVLKSILDYPLTIVEAPIGYGKTTAVREFLAAMGVSVIWVSFFSENDTPEAFWNRLAAGVGSLDPAAGIRLKSLGIPANESQATTIVSIMSELEYSADTTLVIDDFHLAKSMRVTGLFRRFVMEMPRDFHIVFITRDTSNIDISELFAKGQCNILPQQTLCFTTGEIRAYCGLMGFRTGEEELKKVLEYTGGWISLTYLILLGMEQGIPVGRNSVIDELVEKVLYDTYDEPIRKFLLRLSVMDAFTVKENNVLYNTTLELVEGYVYGCLEQSDSIPAWLLTGDMTPACFLYRGMAFNYIVQGKAVLLSKDYIRLEILTETFPLYFGIFHNQLGFLHNQILSAAAKYHLYGMEKGCAALEDAIDMAREDHLVLIFAEYAPAIMDMIRNIARGSRDVYLNEVLKACERYIESLKSASQNTVSLTKREIEVLSLAAEGFKRDKIAGKLYVSPGTVKVHLENIYRKLEVSGKAAAVKKAQKLKIL